MEVDGCQSPAPRFPERHREAILIPVDHISQKEEVRRFWQRRPCGSGHADAPEASAEYFSQVALRRDQLEPFIATYADFKSSRGEDVLEIGVGLGSDFVRFARAGARATGVDLTPRSVEMVTQRLALEGLTGVVRVADAEALPFVDDRFDVVYSWGVLHHTPSPEKAFSEALRVLRPGGRACIMVYARHSWVAFGLWARYGLLSGHPTRSLSDVVGSNMESVGTRAYTKAELRSAFGALADLQIEQVATPYDARVAGPFASLTGSQLGWFTVVRGRKPHG